MNHIITTCSKQYNSKLTQYRAEADILVKELAFHKSTYGKYTKKLHQVVDTLEEKKMRMKETLSEIRKFHNDLLEKMMELQEDCNQEKIYSFLDHVEMALNEGISKIDGINI